MIGCFSAPPSAELCPNKPKALSLGSVAWQGRTSSRTRTKGIAVFCNEQHPENEDTNEVDFGLWLQEIHFGTEEPCDNNHNLPINAPSAAVE